MNRTFRGCLKAYCAELSGMRTTSLRRLCAAARERAPRVAEPLLLLAFEEGREDYLLKLAEGSRLGEEWEGAAESIRERGGVLPFLESGEAPKRYAAVLDAYRAPDDALAADRRINGLLRTRTLAALDAAGMTRYRLCKDLGLNAGNLYAYLAGDDAKVSRATARRIMEHASAAARETARG